MRGAQAEVQRDIMYQRRLLKTSEIVVATVQGRVQGRARMREFIGRPTAFGYSTWNHSASTLKRQCMMTMKGMQDDHEGRYMIVRTFATS